MLTIAMRLLCHEKWNRKAPKVIGVYTEAILMHVLHFQYFTLEMVKKLAMFSPKIAKNAHYALIGAR